CRNHRHRNDRYRNHPQLPETTILCTCLPAIWTGSTGEIWPPIKDLFPHWTIPTTGSVRWRRCCFIVAPPVRRGEAGAFIESKRFIMEWFHTTKREHERPNGGLASSHEIQSAFAEQREYLYWI